MGKILIFIGLSLAVLGVIWHFGEKLGLGKLPGDIVIKTQRVGFYFPITTCILISVVLSFLLWLFRHFRH